MNLAKQKSKLHTSEFEAVKEGDTLDASYVIEESVYQGFLDTFQDVNPVHVDESYAKSKGFEGRVMHGAILNGFVSHFIGMRFPGENSLLLSVDSKYLKPCYLGDPLELRCKVAQKNESHRVLSLNCAFFRNADMVARFTIQVKYL